MTYAFGWKTERLVSVSIEQRTTLLIEERPRLKPTIFGNCKFEVEEIHQAYYSLRR